MALASGAPLLRATRYFSATFLRAYYEQLGQANATSREQEAASVIQSRFRDHTNERTKRAPATMTGTRSKHARLTLFRHLLSARGPDGDSTYVPRERLRFRARA